MSTDDRELVREFESRLHVLDWGQAYDSWPLLQVDSFSWRPHHHASVFAMTYRHADRGVFEPYETGGPHMRSHP